jgi:hypothetical protein
MPVLVTGIHVVSDDKADVDDRNKFGHDDSATLTAEPVGRQYVGRVSRVAA